MFSAILIEKTQSGQEVKVAQVDEAQLPAADVMIDVEYSTINYKDGLAITGRLPVVRKFPMVPGIDLAGVVRESAHADWKKGDRVILNGWGAGETHWGGLAQKARLKGEWLVPLPPVFTSRQAMAIGTAGYTASICVEALLAQSVEPDQGEILVTGASGGVGSIAIALLSKEGFRVAASTGKPWEADYLKRLGATTIIDRAELAQAGKPLQVERWGAVVDTVGSHTLANACAQSRHSGVVVACGMAQGMDFPASLAPFIQRGLTLIGIDSVMALKQVRLAAWGRLARDLSRTAIDMIAHEIALGDVVAAASDVLEGKVRGRIVVDVNR